MFTNECLSPNVGGLYAILIDGVKSKVVVWIYSNINEKEMRKTWEKTEETISAITFDLLF